MNIILLGCSEQMARIMGGARRRGQGISPVLKPPNLQRRTSAYNHMPEMKPNGEVGDRVMRTILSKLL